MTINRSLALSEQLQTLMRTDLLHQFSENFPFELIKTHSSKNDKVVRRDRVYNTENTLLTMLVSSIQEDKSLKQSVNVFKSVFEQQGKVLKEKEAIELEELIAESNQSKQTEILARRGRPRLFKSQLLKSKTMDISDNTAGYCKARERLDLELVNKLFTYSTDFKEMKSKLWHGMTTFIADGTYFQMQDSKELRDKYYVKQNDGVYPQGLLQCVIRQGSGEILAFKIGTRHQSELELVKPLIDSLPKGSLLLADDLYSTYAIFSLIQNQGCYLIVPGKRERNYTIVKKIADGDEIVLLKKTNKPDWLSMEQWASIPKTLQMRRISYQSPIDENEELVLYTTIMDESISKIDIILKYTTRWDIEITIREVKTIMGINIARSKNEEMVFKEMTIALTAYNMIRKIIAKSVDKTEIPPQSNIVYECFETNQGLLVDKKGRVYHHWSTGRYGSAIKANSKTKIT
jgi:hypothetical protein